MGTHFRYTDALCNRYPEINAADDPQMPKMLDSPPLTAFGGRLAHWRKQRGLSQGALAERLGIKQSSLSELESGKSKSPSADVLVKACDVLQVRPRYLWLGEEPAELQNFSELSGPEAQLVMMFRSLPTDAARQALMIDMNAKQKPPAGQPQGRIVDRLKQRLGAPIQETFPNDEYNRQDRKDRGR